MDVVRQLVKAVQRSSRNQAHQSRATGSIASMSSCRLSICSGFSTVRSEAHQLHRPGWRDSEILLPSA